MTSISDFLGDDHLRCDTIYADAEAAISKGNWEAGDRLAHEFIEAMRHHFTMEEDVLFPEFEAATGMTSGPTAIMRMEHAQMRHLFDEMEGAIQARDTQGFLGAGETLLMMMQQHNAKEEQVLYPMADRTLGEGRHDTIGRMRQTGR